MSAPRQIVFLGPPGAGKGTQAKRLSHHFGLGVCSTGSLLRCEEQRDSPLAHEIHAYLKDGNFVPDALMLRMISTWLTDQGAEFVLDGFPRTLAQGKALDAFLEETGRSQAVAIWLDVTTSEVESRVSHREVCDRCGNVWPRDEAPKQCPDCQGPTGPRADDSVELFRSRLAEYEAKTLPLLPYYRQDHRLHEICGRGSPDEVFRRILTALDS